MTCTAAPTTPCCSSFVWPPALRPRYAGKHGNQSLLLLAFCCASRPNGSFRHGKARALDPIGVARHRPCYDRLRRCMWPGLDVHDARCGTGCRRRLENSQNEVARAVHPKCPRSCESARSQAHIPRRHITARANLVVRGCRRCLPHGVVITEGGYCSEVLQRCTNNNNISRTLRTVMHRSYRNAAQGLT